MGKCFDDDSGVSNAVGADLPKRGKVKTIPQQAHSSDVTPFWTVCQPSECILSSSSRSTTWGASSHSDGETVNFDTVSVNSLASIAGVKQKKRNATGPVTSSEAKKAIVNVTSSEKKKTKKSSDTGHIRRPMNNFMLYAYHARKRIQEEMPHINDHAQFSKIIGARWRALPEEEKDHYTQEAAKLHARLLEKHPNYKYQPRRKAKMSGGSTRNRTSATAPCQKSHYVSEDIGIAQGQLKLRVSIRNSVFQKSPTKLSQPEKPKVKVTKLNEEEKPIKANASPLTPPDTPSTADARSPGNSSKNWKHPTDEQLQQLMAKLEDPRHDVDTLNPDNYPELIINLQDFNSI